jgi:hypothetical protein
VARDRQVDHLLDRVEVWKKRGGWMLRRQDGGKKNAAGRGLNVMVTISGDWRTFTPRGQSSSLPLGSG